MPHGTGAKAFLLSPGQRRGSGWAPAEFIVAWTEEVANRWFGWSRTEPVVFRSNCGNVGTVYCALSQFDLDRSG